MKSLVALFQIKEDFVNYVQLQIDPKANIVLKENTLPRFFECQKDRRRTFPTKPRRLVEKRQRQQLLKEAEEEFCIKKPKIDLGDAGKVPGIDEDQADSIKGSVNKGSALKDHAQIP